MRLVALTAAFLGLLGLYAGSQVFDFSSKSPIEPCDAPQTFWVKLLVGRTANQAPGIRYRDMKAAIVVAVYDPKWKEAALPGIGFTVRFNPAYVVFADYDATVSSLFRADDPQNEYDEWMVWTKLPPVPPTLVGVKLVFQVLCWENGVPPTNYFLSHPWYAPNDFTTRGPNLLIIPK
jgi:hypothetical protein